MIAEGVIKEFGKTSSSTPKVLVGDKWLVAGQFDTSHFEVGQKVAIQYHPWDKNPKTLLLDTMTLLPHQPGAPGAGAYTEVHPAPLAQPLNEGLTQPQLALVSNVLAHAIEGKLINSHTDISTWVSATVHAITHYDDSIPFEP